MVIDGGFEHYITLGLVTCALCYCRGLYLGYLKTRSSLAGVKVVVSKQFPNLLPHTKIRDNPHISKYVTIYYVCGQGHWMTHCID